MLYCWGHDYAGAIGDGSGSDSAVPVQIMTDVADIADGGKNMNCAIKNNGSAFCWGNEGEGGSLVMAMHMQILPDHLWSFQVRNGLKTW